MARSQGVGGAGYHQLSDDLTEMTAEELAKIKSDAHKEKFLAQDQIRKARERHTRAETMLWMACVEMERRSR